jgi:hypothetical protein
LLGKGVTFFAGKLGELKRIQVFIKSIATVKDKLLNARNPASKVSVMTGEAHMTGKVLSSSVF